MGGGVSFDDLALAWERARLGDKQALFKIDFDHEGAKAAFKLLFPLRNEILSERAVLSKTADELGVPTEILYELLNERASSLVASESSASESSGWSLEDALRIRTAIVDDLGDGAPDNDLKRLLQTPHPDSSPQEIDNYIKNLK